MRILVLSDSHGLADPRIAALAHGCDLAVHGGDMGSAAVLDQIRPRDGRVLAVVGNNDSPAQWPAHDLARLARLPQQLTEPLPGGDLAVIHGHQTRARDRHARLRSRFPGARVIVYGHSHRLAVDQEALPWVINPGAAGRSRTFGGPSCLILSATASDWCLETYQFAPVRGPRAPALRHCPDLVG